jgi:hypothetical protein
MADLRDHFALADRLEVPELWGRAAALAEEIPDATVGISDRREERSRIVAAVLAILVFAAAGAFVWDAFSRSDGAPAIEPQPSVDPWSSLSPGLNELPPPPSSRYGAATVWTGDRLVVWGGARNDGATSFDDGFALDPQSERWTTIPVAPLDARYFPVSVWTGREVLIWGGWHDDNDFVSDGAAYDPATATWRLLADAPIPFARSVGVWTGNEMLVWNPEAKGAAAYDPTTDTWRLLPDSPIALERVDGSLWTGADMVVGGLSTSGPNSPYDGRVLAFDPSSDRWRELPPPDLDGNAITLVWTGSEVIGIDLNHVVRSYRLGDDRWTNLPAIPMNAREFSPQAAFADGELFVDTFSGQVVLNLATRTWSSVPAVRPADGYLTPITAGSAIVLWQAAPTAPAPERLLVWKPAAQPSPLDQLSPVLRNAVVNRITGTEFAESIGVELVGGVPPGCTDYVEVSSAGGYCLTGVVKSVAEGFVAGHLLQSDVPSLDTIQLWLDADPGP